MPEPRVLITGASGFIGTNLLEAYRRKGVAVLNFDLRPPQSPDHTRFWRCGDLLRQETLRDTLSGFQPSLIVHLAARTDLGGKTVADYPANTEGVANLVRAIQQCPSPPAHVIFASSVFVFQRGQQPRHDTDFNPYTVYGASKVEGERVVRASTLPCTWSIVRPTSIWGPWFGVPFRQFFRAIARGRYVHPRATRIERTLGFVGNTINQLQHLGAAPTADVAGRSFFLGDPAIELGDWADRIAAAMGRPQPPRVPVAVLQALAVAGDSAKRLGWANPPITSFRLHNLLTGGVVDLLPIDRVAGPPRITLEAGIRETIAWLSLRSGPKSPRVPPS